MRRLIKMDNGKIQLHNVDFDDFIKAVDECKGDVYLETKDGDVLNLKSKLCQMLGLSTILKNTEVTEATIRCTNPDDETMLFRFNLYGEIPGEDKKEGEKMAENNFLNYKGKPLVRSGKEIFYGDMADAYVIKFTVLSETKEDKLPEKVTVQLLKSDTQLPDKDRIVKETVKESFFDALDFGFVWLERALKN